MLWAPDSCNATLGGTQREALCELVALILPDKGIDKRRSRSARPPDVQKVSVLREPLRGPRALCVQELVLLPDERTPSVELLYRKLSIDARLAESPSVGGVSELPDDVPAASGYTALAASRQRSIVALDIYAADDAVVAVGCEPWMLPWVVPHTTSLAARCAT